jgi:hypothetical protein
MSTKTVRKRIALVAIAAVGLGVISVAPATAANNSATGGVNPASAAGILNLATRSDASGVASSTVTADNTNRSAGLINNSTIMTTGDITGTATMLSNGELVFYSTGVQDDNSTIVVSGGTISRASGSVTSHATSADRTMFTIFGDAAAATFAVGVRPNSGVTTMAVELWTNTSITTSGNVDEALDRAVAVNAGSLSKGSLIQKYTVTVATTSTVGVYSAADSICVLGTASTTTQGTTDSDGAGVIANGSNGYVDFSLVDAFGSAVTGAVVIEATGGAGLAYNGDYLYTTSASDFNLVAVSTDASGKVDVARPAALDNKSFTTTVTIKFNGVTACTKTIRFEGEVAKITASSPLIARTGATSASAFRTKFEDDKGFALYPQSGVIAVATTLNSTVTSINANATPPNSTTGALGKGSVTCSGTAGSYLSDGSANLQLQYTNTRSGTVVKSNIWKQTCAGDAYTVKASFDKAVYQPGSVATLTIEGRTAAGNLANAYDPISETSSLVAVTGGGTYVTAPANGDLLDSADGKKTYQLVASSTEGTYTAVVTVPVVTALNSDQGNISLPYEIKSGTATVTNAEVLKSIVSLIASINKQIQALQKLILRR